MDNHESTDEWRKGWKPNAENDDNVSDEAAESPAGEAVEESLRGDGEGQESEDLIGPHGVYTLAVAFACGCGRRSTILNPRAIVTALQQAPMMIRCNGCGQEVPADFGVPEPTDEEKKSSGLVGTDGLPL